MIEAVLLAERPVFPCTVAVNDATITLQADGTVSGDVAAFCSTVFAMTSFGGSNPYALQLWVVATLLRALPALSTPHTVSKTGIGFE
jgi:hypothetical protein